MKRKYNIADARLLVHTGKILLALEEDLPDFTAIDPDLNEALVATQKNKYEIALAEGGDDVSRGALGVKTEVLLEEVKRAGKILKHLRYWVKKVYEDDPAGLKLFQFGKYWKVRNRQAALIAYLNALATTVDEQRPKLEAANAPADLLDSVLAITKSLEEANVRQKNGKAGRQADTVKRVERLNGIYAVCVAFSNAAEFAYEESPAKRKFYLLPGNSRPSAEDEGDDIK